MRLNGGHLLDLLRAVWGNLGRSRLEWRCLLVFADGYFSKNIEGNMPARKKKISPDFLKLRNLGSNSPFFPHGREEVHVDLYKLLKNKNPAEIVINLSMGGQTYRLNLRRNGFPF